MFAKGSHWEEGYIRPSKSVHLVRIHASCTNNCAQFLRVAARLNGLTGGSCRRIKGVVAASGNHQESRQQSFDLQARIEIDETCTTVLRHESRLRLLYSVEGCSRQQKPRQGYWISASQ